MRNSFVMKTPAARRAKVWAAGSLAAALASTVAPPAQADELGAMAKRLATLRGEVESLSDELAAQKSDLQEQVRSYARQKAELELSVQREETRMQKLRKAVEEKKAQVAAEKAAGDDVGPAFERDLVRVRDYVKGTLPFRLKERLAELDKLEDQYKTGLIAPQRALNRLWGFVEDELRMTRESGLYAQPVAIDGNERLADVIRMGMVALYYQTNDGRYGIVSRQDDAWTEAAIDDEDGRKQVRDLFETFKKQIRVGYFTLPNAGLGAASAKP